MKLSDIYYDSHFGEFEELFRQSGVPVHFRKGEAIPTDYKIRNIFYTVNGLSKYFFVHENGTEKVTGIFGPGTLIPYSLCLPVSEKKLRLQGLLQIPDPDRCGRYMPEAGNVSQTV